MSSGKFSDYNKQGLASARPVSLDLYSGSFGLYHSTDTGALDLWSGTGWINIIAGAAASGYDIVTEASAFTATVGDHDGLARYVRAGGNVTFNSTESYVAGMAFNIRATGSISLVGTGVTLTPPAGGTLALTAGMSVQVVMTSGTTADVIGQTVAA